MCVYQTIKIRSVGFNLHLCSRPLDMSTATSAVQAAQWALFCPGVRDTERKKEKERLI